MIQLKLLLCAQGVVRDADSNNVSAFNILESIQAAGFPMFIQQLDILALLDGVTRMGRSTRCTFASPLTGRTW